MEIKADFKNNNKSYTTIVKGRIENKNQKEN